MFNRTFNRALLLIANILGIQLPCIVLNFFYIRIFISTVQAKRRAISHNQLKQKKAKIDYKFSVGLFASLFLFTCTLIPYSIMLIVDYEDKLHKVFHMYGLVLMRINSCLNPVLYFLTNPMFRKGYKNFYYFLFNRKKYSFSIVKKEKMLLNERLLQKEIKMKKLTKTDENNQI